MSTFEALTKLVGVFERDIESAKALTSPNVEDDLAIKAAIVGFSYSAPTSDWARIHHDYVKTRLDSDYSSDELEYYGDNGENVKLFFALSIGFVLGLRQQNNITDEEFRIGEQQIPGIIMLHLPTLTAQAV